MDVNQLIGSVAALYFKQRISDSDKSSTARYLLDSLSAQQTAAIANAILTDPALSSQVEIKLPEHWVGGLGLPSTCLTKERATFYRNAPCDKPALLIATPGDDEQQSLADLTIIDSNQIRANVELWVRVAANDLPIADQHRRWWLAALSALQEVTQVALDRFALYVLETRTQIEDGKAFLDALGSALPALRWPRNPAIFRALNDKTARQVSKWKALYNQVFRRQACFLRKYTPNNQLLSSDDLNTSFDRVKDAIPDQYHPPIDSFISAPSRWNPEAEALAKIDWEAIRPLFDGLKPERFNLGRATLQFYNEQEEGRLTKDEQDYLTNLADKRRSSDPIDDDLTFYRAHRGELKESPTLKSKWDRFIFGAPIEATDFLVGLASCLESLFDQDILGSTRRLTISADRRTKRDLRKLNVDAGLYFSFRYRGLRELLGRSVFDVGSLFEFDSVHQEWSQDRKYKPNQSLSRAALEIKFYVALDIDDGAIENHRQLIWRFDPNAIGSELCADWARRLIDHPMIMGTASRESVGAKGSSQPLNLRDVRTLSAAFGQDRGSLIPVHRREYDLDHIWRANLSEAKQRGAISETVASKLNFQFETFQTAYRAAIQAFPKTGISAPEINHQYIAYGELLRALCTQAKGDRNRELLLKPVLAMGTVPVTNGPPTAIVAPWNPLRMQAMASKGVRLGALIKFLLNAENVLFGDASLYFKEFRDELEHPYFPEIALGWLQRKAELLSLSDSYTDYTLHERPMADPDIGESLNDNPAKSAIQIVEMVQRYLDLFPHEQAGLSVVLYNCDSAGLPQAVVNKINEMHEDESDMRCEVILRHRDRQKLQKLYEEIVESGGEADADTFVASEASRDFMARLRIGIMADQAPAPDPKDGPRTDLVFLHDVIARRARLEWHEEQSPFTPLSELVPSRWSRRRPSPIDEEKSIVYLCSPAQTKEGWAYLTAITTFFKGDWDGREDRRLMPARQLDFNDPGTSEIFKESHNLGNWVVNFDELLDRRQLVNQGVRVIRYKQAATQGRNLLVSSTASLGLLQSMLQNRIQDLLPELPVNDLRSLANKFIDEANRISGDIVLRAAKRGKNASELMGIVLSYFLAVQDLPAQSKFGCYFLDDYAEWLGHREQQIADLLLLCPYVDPSGAKQLTIILTESKYIAEDALNEKRRESQKQIRDTLTRISQALLGTQHHMDRDLWLARFSDLLLSGIQYSASDELDLIAFRRAVREGQCSIFLRGYSHVFVSGPSDATECSDFVKVSGIAGAFQEVYSRAKTRALVSNYATDASPTPIRLTVVKQREIDQRDFTPIVPVRSLGSADITSKPSQSNHQTTTGQTTTATAPPKSTSQTPSVEPSTSSKVEIKTQKWASVGIEHIISARQLPSLSSPAEEDWLKQTVSRTRAALQEFQLHSKVLDQRLTPNAALIRFQGAPNMTVELVLRRRSEFLTTHGLDIIAVRGEPGAVVISVARPSRKILHTLDVWSGWKPEIFNGNHSLLVAVREDDNQPLFISPTDNSPHTLIAGATGSGKSVLMQNIILAIACTNTPKQAKIVLIDPKLGVDYFSFEGLPHLTAGIVEDQDAAIDTLNQLLVEMDRRYAVLKQNRCSNLLELQAKPEASEHLPCLWVVHDEFAEWMMTDHYRDTVSNVVSRLGVKARAAGIFLVFAAQRPDNNVMPLQLRSNLGNRLILRVDSEGTSEIALGDRGAERLLGHGHMIAKLEGATSLVYCQVPLITPPEIQQLVAAIRSTHLSSHSPHDGLSS